MGIPSLSNLLCSSLLCRMLASFEFPLGSRISSGDELREGHRLRTVGVQVSCDRVAKVFIKTFPADERCRRYTAISH